MTNKPLYHWGQADRQKYQFLGTYKDHDIWFVQSMKRIYLRYRGTQGFITSSWMRIADKKLVTKTAISSRAYIYYYAVDTFFNDPSISPNAKNALRV